MAAVLTGAQKSALILLALDRDAATRVLRSLPQPIIEQIVPHMVHPPTVEPALYQALLAQMADACEAALHLNQMGPAYVQELLAQALGPNRASLLMRQLTDGSSEQPFSILLRADLDQAASVLAQEHPQLVALMLSHIPPHVAAALLSKMPPAVAAEATRRLAHLGRVDPSVVKSLESVLESKLTVVNPLEVTGGLDHIVSILNASEPSTERTILDQISTVDPTLASDIRNQLFTFEDLRKLDDLVLQTILRRVNTRTLAMALRGASHELRDKIFANMTQDMAELVQDDMEALGAQKVRDVEAAQHTITHLVHELEDAGEIELVHGDQEAVI